MTEFKESNIDKPSNYGCCAYKKDFSKMKYANLITMKKREDFSLIEEGHYQEFLGHYYYCLNHAECLICENGKLINSEVDNAAICDKCGHKIIFG